MKSTERTLKAGSGSEDREMRFGAFRMLPAQRKLLLADDPVPLGQRAFDLLAAMAERQGEVVTKDELMAEVWPGTIVEDNTIAAQMSAIRKALAKDPALRGCLQAVPGRGYCFATPIDVRPSSHGHSRTDTNRMSGVLSIVVLPFENLSSDPEQGYFAQGVTDSITTDLSRISGLLVIASTSATAIDGRHADLRQVSENVGARYVLKGSVQRSGATTRVGTQLVDGYSCALVWSELFSGDTDDLFALQDEITGRIAVSIGRRIFTSAASANTVRNPGRNSCDLVFRGIEADNRPQSLESLEEQERLFQTAVELDPANGDAQARLARAILLQSVQGHAPTERKQDALQRGAKAAERALALDPNNARAHLAISYLHMLRGDFDRCARSSEQAIALDRNLAMAHNMLATALAHLGHGRQAVKEAGIALRLDPFGPQFDVYVTTLGLSRLILDDVAGALECFLRARASNTRLARAHAWTAIALALSGDIKAAKATVRELLDLAPQYRLSETVDGCLATSKPAYREFYENIVHPNAVLSELPI